MKINMLWAFAGVGGVLVLPSAADAAYVGLANVLHTQAMVGQGTGAPVLRNVYRVYALFSDSNDYLTSVAGSPTLGNMTIQSGGGWSGGPGGPFINPLGGGATSPGSSYVGSQVEWDTFVTIGLASWGDPNGPAFQLQDDTGLSPGFAGLPNSGFYSSNNAGWFTPGTVEQGRAGNGISLHGYWGVLIMQLTVNAGNGVSGTVAIGGVNNNPLAGGTTFQTSADQTFATPPAPGVLAVFGLAGVLGLGRRRRSTSALRCD
jgi:hypothetical protein